MVEMQIFGRAAFNAFALIPDGDFDQHVIRYTA